MFNLNKVNHIQVLGDFSEGADFELITTAKQTDSRYGNFRYTKSDLQEMADNFNDNIVGTDIAVDLNHDPAGIALAWLKEGSMKVAKSSRLPGHFSLFAKLHNFTPRGKELVKTGAVKYFSLELQHKFEKFVGKTKKTFKNVIRGLALTNRPVIKDMLPTFSEFNLKLSEKKNMEAFKIFLAQLKAQEIVSLSEKDTMKKMFVSLDETEQKEVKEDKEEVEKKPEETKKEGDEKTEEEKEAEAKAAKEKEEEDNKDLSETRKELNETKIKADKALSELRKRDLSESCKGMMLSDDKKELSFGFITDAKDNLINFCMSLSEDQMIKFSELWKQAKAVDFSENGVDNKGDVTVKASEKTEDGVDVDPKSNELDAKVKKYQAENKDATYEEAYEECI